MTCSTSVTSVDASFKFYADQRNCETDLGTSINREREGLQLLGGNINDSKLKSCDKMQNVGFVQGIKEAETNDNTAIPSITTVDGESSTLHSRQSSDSCYTSSSSAVGDNCQSKSNTNYTFAELGNCLQGNIVGLHRKMVSWPGES